MEHRERLSNLIRQEASLTDKNKVIVDAFEKVAKYFEPVKNKIDKTELNKSNYTILTDKKGASIVVANQSLYFFDKGDYIQIVYGNNDARPHEYDRLIVSDNNVKSKKYDEFLTDELLDKYLDLFF